MEQTSATTPIILNDGQLAVVRDGGTVVAKDANGCAVGVRGPGNKPHKHKILYVIDLNERALEMVENDPEGYPVREAEVARHGWCIRR